MLISAYCEEAEVKVGIMSLYWRLSRRNLMKKFDRINLRGVPITMVGKDRELEEWTIAGSP
jgi:hypothetical protein